MCRNITTLRGLEPEATPTEIEAAARQYVRKVSGITKTSAANEARFEEAVADIAAITAALLADLPPRRNPPPTLPPLRRIAARKAAEAEGQPEAGDDAHTHTHPDGTTHTHTHDEDHQHEHV